MSRDEVHIFWWRCDRYECKVSAQVMGDGVPDGWWRIRSTYGTRGPLTYDTNALTFCSEACAIELRDAMLTTQKVSDSGTPASVLLTALQVTSDA